MPDGLARLPHLRRNLAIIWALLALEDWGRHATWSGAGNRVAPHFAILRYTFAVSAFWAVASWVLFVIIDYIAACRRRTELLLLGVAILACTLLSIVANACFVSAIGPFRTHPFASILLYILRLDFHVTLVWTVLIVALGRGLQWWHLEESAAVRQSRLESARLTAELDALASQLEPHFLFNTLSGISTVSARDTTMAREMVDSLREMLAYVTMSARDGVPLRDEIRVAERYLRLQSIRFTDRLRVHFAVDPQALGCTVPRLTLQPVLENAIKYGIGSLEDGGEITIAVRADLSRLVIEVRNTDEGSDAHVSAGHGIGLACVRARLDLLFGERHSFSIDRTSEPHSVTVRMTMPRAEHGTTISPTPEPKMSGGPDIDDLNAKPVRLLAIPSVVRYAVICSVFYELLMGLRLAGGEPRPDEITYHGASLISFLALDGIAGILVTLGIFAALDYLAALRAGRIFGYLGHIVTLIAAVLLVTTAEAGIRTSLSSARHPFAVLWSSGLRNEFHDTLLLVAFLTGLGITLRNWAATGIRRLAESRLEEAVARARLAALAATVPPEQLAGDLRRIAAALEGGMGDARQMIAALATRLRRSFGDRGAADPLPATQNPAALL